MMKLLTGTFKSKSVPWANTPGEVWISNCFFQICALYRGSVFFSTIAITARQMKPEDGVQLTDTMIFSVFAIYCAQTFYFSNH